ncbi:alpha/beta hydrolase family esterase [Actinomadura xylanilytica]|uniref:alpha/beta hydrolase family esterase n=1 Tax=Actinomadura xylanilytica TaxID=887459 RepID=UPI00255AB3EC|nr:PHB depolymerase family esterase [Actinomadura xylanilytica]MDL4775648.1 PHB depolymerase family esterase [Actinomadura xylanilytica]
MRRTRRIPHLSPALVLSLVLCLALALSACDGTRNDAGTPGKGKSDDRRPATVQGIPTDAGTHKQKMGVGTVGHREFLLHVPSKVAGGKWRGGRPAAPPPLVIALHGGLATMGQMRSLTGFDGLSDEQGFLVAYPDGFMTTWNAGDCCGAAKVAGTDDVGFLTKLIDKLTGAGLADPDRVYVTGFSNGAGMAYRLACEKPGKVAAIGVVEGALVTRCDPGRPVSAMIFHGTADRNVPFNGGGRRDFNDGSPFPPVSQAVEFWRRLAHLPEPTRRVKALGGDTDCNATGKGAGGAEVTFCKIEGGTHRWPSGAGALLWDFFSAHPRTR